MSALKSKDARLKLHRSMVRTGEAGNIFWESIGKGRAVGYRRLEGSATGNWYARLYDSNKAGSPYHRHAIGTADDTAPANATDILDFSQALKLASTFDPWGQDEDDQVGTVADACRVYLEWAEHNRPKSYDTIKSCFNCHVVDSEISSIPVSRLTIRHLEQWKNRQALKPRQHVSGTEYEIVTEDDKRSRKASANRSVAWLKAALSHCKNIGAITADDAAWRLLRPFKGVTRSGRKNQASYLTEKQLGLLFEHIDDQCFLNLVKGAVYLGARYTELAQFRVGDWDADNETLTVVAGKGDKRRNIFLGTAATSLLNQLCPGRQSDEPIFLKSNGTPWGKNHQQRPLERAVKAAGIKPRISFHGLRASYCSIYLMAGGNIFDLAKQLGHSDTQMLSQHYGHLSNTHRQEQARACEPKIRVTKPIKGGRGRETTLH